MKALSIRQPWAWMILHAAKNVENRSWSTNVRGQIYIHASKSCTVAEFENAIEGALMLDLEPRHTDAILSLTNPKDMARGGIVGSVEIVDCVRGKFSQWHAEGQWAFVLKNPKLLPFRPCSGALGFFEVAA